jgi:hypothetical protein
MIVRTLLFGLVVSLVVSALRKATGFERPSEANLGVVRLRLSHSIGGYERVPRRNAGQFFVILAALDH